MPSVTKSWASSGRLRAAGYQSDIFVETADPRLEPLTRDYRELVDASHRDNLLLHHFSIGSKASRTAYAVPDRMALIYHNITPPEYFVGVHRTLARQCFRGRRELLRVRGPLRSGAGRLGIQPAGSRSARLSADGRPAGGARLLAPRRASRTASWPDQFDDDWTNVLFVGRVIANKKIEDLIRIFHAYHTLYNPRSRLLIVGVFSLFERYLAGLNHLVEELGARDVHFVGHVSNAELVAYYEVADLFLCASEHEGFCVPLVEAFYKQVPVLAYAATAVPATMDGAGVLYDDQGSGLRRGADGRDPVGHAAPGCESSTISSRRSGGCGRRTSPERCFDSSIGFSDGRRAGAPSVAFDFWQQFDAAEELEEIRLRPSFSVQGAAMIINQWLPAAHRGRCDRRQRPPACATCWRSLGPPVGDLRADDRRRAERRRAAIRRHRVEQGRRDDVSLCACRRR